MSRKNAYIRAHPRGADVQDETNGMDIRDLRQSRRVSELAPLICEGSGDAAKCG